MKRQVVRMKTKHWILLLALLLLLCGIGIFAMRRLAPQERRAEIYQNGTLIQTVDLSALHEPVEIPVHGENGEENIILALPGEIRMQSANCPDQLCVHQGSIQNGTVPIVCLPHRIVIRIADSSAGPDAVSN